MNSGHKKILVVVTICFLAGINMIQVKVNKSLKSELSSLRNLYLWTEAKLVAYEAQTEIALLNPPLHIRQEPAAEVKTSAIRLVVFFDDSACSPCTEMQLNWFEHFATLLGITVEMLNTRRPNSQNYDDFCNSIKKLHLQNSVICVILDRHNNVILCYIEEPGGEKKRDSFSRQVVALQKLLSHREEKDLHHKAKLRVNPM